MLAVKIKNSILKLYLSILLVFICTILLNAQLIIIDNNDEYTKVLIDRVDGYLDSIVDKTDSDTYISVRNIVIKQYIDLSNIHDNRDIDIAIIEKDASLNALGKSRKIDLIKLKSEEAVYNLHAEYLGRLSAELTLEQIDEVKDGMTYGIFPNTYKVYLEQNPTMTKKQRKYTYSALYAARDLAMDKGSSDEKHATFRMYKGIINNYLSGMTDTSDVIQDETDAYTKVLIDRVNGYLPSVIDRTDSLRYIYVRNIVIQQYKDLSQIHDKRDEDLNSMQANTSLEASIINDSIDLIKLKAENDVYILHADYLGRLNAEIQIEQVDGVKDGMTYGVFPNTYKVYLEQNIDITELQKQFTFGSLFAARELAMDKGSSDEKHNTFRKYKGIVNNYLAGLYDPNNHLDESADTLETDSENPDSTYTQISISSEISLIKAKVYPLPLTSTSTLEIKNEEIISEIALYNLSGQKVLNIINSPLNIGVHYLNFNTLDITNGIYLIKINSRYNSITIKLIK